MRRDKSGFDCKKKRSDKIGTELIGQDLKATRNEVIGEDMTETDWI